MTSVTADREAEDAAGTFGARKAEIEALLHQETAAGVSRLRGLAAGVAGWFGREPVLDFVTWEEFTRRAGAGPAEVTREHAGRSITARCPGPRGTRVRAALHLA